MRNALPLVALAGVSAAGCTGFEHKTTVTGPSSSTLSGLTGAWTSGNIAGS